MDNVMWRFPASGHGERKGISSGDTEAFKGSPVKAFAREILQNSIDARASDEEATIVEFKVFDMRTRDIPGYSDLKDSYRRCIEFWSHKKDYVDEYKSMMRLLEQEYITCLRVSDFNTTGLIGVETTNQTNNKFLALTKGTGVSEKTSAVAAGSKGVGKNAAFLMSGIRTVFYSTITNQDIHGNPCINKGSIGVSELVSGYIDDDSTVQKRDYTQGTGYFSKDIFNSALDTTINLDPKFEARTSKIGTDIIIIGFNTNDDWENEVVNSILDSFMSTIMRNDLIVHVNNLELSRFTVGNVVYDTSIISRSNFANVVSQYKLLIGGENVSVYDIETEYGICELYILRLTREEEELATHKCVMIRHPLMKIKDEPLGASFRISAMCIINNGKLGEVLRSIENPQHIDWETKRIKDRSERREVERVLRDIKEQIKQRVIECLQLGDENPIDPYGAGDFLPDLDVGDSNSSGDNNKKPGEKVSVSTPKENSTFIKTANSDEGNNNGLEPDIGSVNEDLDGDVSHPDGHNDNDGAEPHSGSNTSQEKEGDSVIFKRSKLSGVRYKVISLDKKNGIVNIVFTAPIDYENCYLNLSLLDDSNSPSQITIISMKCNGVEVVSKDNKEFGPFTISTNKKIILEVKTTLKEYFASEVKIICK